MNNLDKETASYIRNYFGNLMTDDEKLALKHHIYTYKTSDAAKMRKILIERGWISWEPEIVNLLKEGYEQFELDIAKRIMNETPGKVFFNTCPKCNKLARTPYARQCRHCGHRWHEMTVAQFKYNDTFQITGGQFFLLGQIVKGTIKQGQFMDLTMLGLNRKPKIEVIEFAHKSKEGKIIGEIRLGTTELSEGEKAFIESNGSFGTLFDIVKER